MLPEIFATSKFSKMILPLVKSTCEINVKAKNAIGTLLRKLDTSLDYYLDNMITAILKF